MTVAPTTTETVYELIGENLGPFNTVFPYATASDIKVYLDNGVGPVLLDSAADYALALSRIARVVGQTLALETWLAADHQAEQEEGRHIVREAARGLQTRLVRAQRRAQVREIAIEAIDAGIAEDCRLDVLARMDLRLEAYDDETRDDLERKPIGALVAEICRALGVQVDWSLWEQEEWACHEGETRAPGSPYAYHRVAPPPDSEPAGSESAGPEPAPDLIGAHHPP